MENKETAKLVSESEKVPLDRIAIGVGDSPIGWMESDLPTGRTEGILERLPFAKLEAPYSQGARTKAFLPSATLVKEGQCEGQCLHWIRRVLLGGRETYKPSSDKQLSDEEIVRKQQRQHKAGAVAHLKHKTARASGIASYNEQLEKYGAAAAQYNKELAEYDDAWEKRKAQYEEIEKKFDEILERKGFKKTPEGSWLVPSDKGEEFDQAMAKWDAFLERWESEKPRAPQLTSQSPDEWSYASFWKSFASDLDSFLDQKLKVSKRRFSNIVVVKSVDRLPHDTAKAFVTAMIDDLDFRPGTCALLSVGLTKGQGEDGSPIPGHAIAAHFKSKAELFLFDPNLGIFSSTSKDQFRQTLESMLGTVWTKDLKWQLEGKYGYSLFRPREDEASNTSEKAVPYSETPQYTAAENKALGNIPRKVDSQ